LFDFLFATGMPKSRRTYTTPTRKISPETRTIWGCLGFPVVLMVCLIVLCIAPFFELPYTFRTDSTTDEPTQTDWAKVPLVLVCILGVLVVGWVGLVLWQHVRYCLYSYVNDPSGYGASSFMLMPALVIMFWVMLPLYIVFRVNVVSRIPKNSVESSLE
jgi:di/tricarboxylate transporter